MSTKPQLLIELLYETPYRSAPINLIMVDLGIDLKTLKGLIATNRKQGHDIFLGGKVDGCVVDDVCFLDELVEGTRVECSDCWREVFSWQLVQSRCGMCENFLVEA